MKIGCHSGSVIDGRRKGRCKGRRFGGVGLRGEGEERRIAEEDSSDGTDSMFERVSVRLGSFYGLIFGMKTEWRRRCQAVGERRPLSRKNHIIRH